MQDAIELAETYLLRLKNDGFTSVYPSEVTSYLKSIGISQGEEVVRVMVKNKDLLELKSGKITLNLVKRKKRRM